MEKNIRIIINNNKIKIINSLLGGSSSFNNLEISQDEIINSLNLLNYFDSNLNSYTASSNLTDLVNVSINNTNLDVTLKKNAYSFPANSLNQNEVLSFTIPDNYSSDLKYFCYSHSSMIGNFTIEDQPLDTSSINTKFYVRLNSDPFSSPYYIFSLTENGAALNESSNLVLYRGISYEFEKTDSGHPFNIGSSHNENATGIVITSNGTGGTVYSEALITVSATDGSTTSSQSFKIKVNQDSEVTGTITFTDNVIINQTITATVNLTDNDGSITLSYQWQVSDDNVTFTNTDTNDTTLSFVIPSDYVGKYIRLQVNSVDSEGGVTVVNSYSREVKDVFGDIQVNTSSDNTVIKLENTYTNTSFNGESSLYYSNFTSSDTNIVPTLSSTWDQIGSSIYGEGFADKSGSAVSLSNDGTIIAIGEYNEYADANSDNFGSVRVFELINNVWTQKGSKLVGEKQMDFFGGYKIKLSGDGTKLFVHADRYNIDTNDNTSSNEGKLYIYTFSNNDWINVNSIEGTSNNHYMLFDVSDDGTVFTIANQNENKVIVYNYDYSTDVYSVKGSEITGYSNFGQNISLSDDGNNICIANNIANYYVYTYDTDNNNWIQKGSTVSSDQGKPNSSLKLNYDGSVFIYGNSAYNSYFVKSITENGDVTSVLTNFQNDGYQLKTAYYGTNDGTNLSDGSIYETLNSSKLLNIYDYNKVRYDVYTFSGDINSPQGAYIKTSYINDIYKFNAESTDTTNELYQVAGSNNNKYIRTSGYFSPKDTGYYRLLFNPTDDAVRIRMREFTNATDIEDNSSSLIPLIRTITTTSFYFKYAVYNFTGNYNQPFDATAGRLTNLSNTLLEWDSGNDSTLWSSLAGSATENIFIRIEVVFTVSVSDTYYFEFKTDDGIRIKIVEYGDTKPNSNIASDWPSMEETENSGYTNWQAHGANWFRYSKSLEKYKIYKAYIEYAQGNGGYYFENKNWRSGNNTLLKWHQQPEMILLDTSSTWDGNNHVWIDPDSFSSGGSRLDIGLDNIYLDSTKNYEFLIEFADGGGGVNLNFYAEKTDTDTFTSLPSSITTEFVSLVNLKSRLEVLKEDPNNQISSNSSDFNFYDPNVGVDKFTYLVFYKDGNVGKTKVYEYKTDVEGNIDWYQVGNDILGLDTDGWGGFRSTLDKSGKQIATTDIRSGNGTVRLLKHDPIGTSILNFYGSGIDSSSTILANNEKLYQGSRLFSPNGNYQLSFQDSDGNLVLYGHSNAYSFDTHNTISEGNPNTYIVMEDGNLNIYDNGQHKLSYTSDSTSGVLALDNNGNFSIVESWIEWQRFSGGGEQGFSIDFTPDGTVIAIGTKNFNNTIHNQGRTEIFQLNNQLTLANVNSLTTGSSTDISFNVMDGTHTDNKTFTISNIEDSTIGELRIISNTFNLFEGSTLTADISSLYDPDGTISITSYEWEISNSSDFNNYSTITSATNSSFTIPKDTESSFSYVGQYIRLKVVANNTDLFSEPRLVFNIEDEVSGTVSFTSNMSLILEDSILTAVTSISDVDNNNLVVDTNDIGSLNLNYQWQISSDDVTFTNIDTDATSSTYKIPVGTYNGQYIRLLVTSTDRRGGTSNILSTSHLIQELDLVTQTEISDSNYFEDNDYVFDLSSIVNSDYDVSFEVKTDDSNGSTTIDTNKLLTFTPNNNYNGISTIVVTASTDSSITSITQDITFTIDIQSVDDKPSGTVSIVGTLLPNNQLSVDLTQITDIDDSSLLYTYIWQMSSDSNTWDSSTDVATSSTYLIPDTNDNENYYIRVKVTVEDSDTNNTEFISNKVQIQKLDLVTTFNESDTIDEDNSYTFDLSSIIDSNYDVSFEIKTDDSNGSSIIDTNKLLTFTPENNYYGSSSIIITASTDSSVTSITQDITFDITINSINDEPTGTVLIVGNALLNNTLSAILDISDIENDVLQYSYSWEISSEIDNWETSVVVGTESVYTIPEDTNYIGQYIRLVVSIQDSDSNDNKIISSNILEISFFKFTIYNELSETIQEDNNFIYDLNNLKDTNQNVFFSINSVSNGQASIDENEIFTFIPDENYYGNTTILLDVRTDSSITTIVNSFLFNLSVVPINDEPTGTISIIGTNLPNKELSVDLTQITDIENDSLTYTYLWQMSSDSNTWDTNISTSSTYTIPDTNDNENKYIRVKVNIQDSDTNNTEFISNTIQIEKINLITSFSQTSTIDEDNNYIFNLLSIIDTNYDVSFEIKTDDINGTSVIDTNKLLTFTPNDNYNGSSTIIVTASTDISITTITQDITFNIIINPINDRPTINNGSFSVNEAEPIQFDLLTLNAIDVDSNSLTYIIKTQPSKGVLLINDTTLTYTSFENQYGSDSFVITVSDGELSADSTIDVLINAVPKILNNFDDLRIQENSDDYIIDLSDKFNDADNSQLSYTSISNDTNLINTSILTTDNKQLGDDIVGRKSFLNSDGTKLIYNDRNDRVIKILKYENENWIQMGSNIDFNSSNFSISHIGNRVAIQIADIIKIYDYTNDWNEILEIDNREINGEMSFSPDDNYILVGNIRYNNSRGDLRIYNCTFNFYLSDNGMVGDNIYDFWGAVSDISNSNIGLYTIAGGTIGENGYVKIFYYDHSEEWYYQMGSTLNNENTFDGFGLSVSLSNDGSIIAVGAPGDDSEIGSNDPLSKGYVKIYEYINNEWSLKGQKLEGENLGDYFGQIVKLSSDGLKLVVTLNNKVNIYEYVNNTWIKINYIDYENIASISLSENADILSISTNSEIKTFSLNESESARLKLSLLPNSKGETTINITATDGNTSVTNSFNVVVFRENEVPVFDSTPVSVAYEDSLYEYNIQVSDVDIEDSNLTIEVVEKPDWLNFVDNQDKTALLSGTPLASHIGTHNVVLKVTDTVLESTTQSFTITVIEVNDNPIFESQPITEIDEKSEYLYNILVSDEENDNVTITIDPVLLPSWLTFTQIDKNNAILQGTPSKFDSGEYNIIITATDEHGKSNSQVFTITVNNVNFPPEITSTPVLNVLRNNLYDYMITIDHDKPVNISAKNIPYWITLVDNENYTARLFGTPDKNESFNVEIIITEIGGLGKVANHNFSIKVDSEPYVKNRISDISILTFDDFIYQLPEFINISSVENKVFYKKSNLIPYDDLIFFDDSFHTRLGETLSYELFINDNLVDIYDWISFTNGIISINPKYHNIGTYIFKIKVTDVMGNSANTEFNVNVNNSLIRFEKQFYNNNRNALVELDSDNSTDAINLAHNYLKTHNFSQEKYNVIIFNSEENKVKIFEGDNNNHTISEHNLVDTFIISKYLDNVRRIKQSLMIKPNKNINIEFK